MGKMRVSALSPVDGRRAIKFGYVVTIVGRSSESGTKQRSNASGFFRLRPCLIGMAIAGAVAVGGDGLSCVFIKARQAILLQGRRGASLQQLASLS